MKVKQGGVTMGWTQDKINEIYLLARNRAAKDRAFRAELISDPKLAIEKLTGEELPEDYSIKIIESDPAYSATFVLPLMLSGELSDDELDNVAGGVSESCGSQSCGAQVVK